jgi:hypothetical protein
VLLRRWLSCASWWLNGAHDESPRILFEAFVAGTFCSLIGMESLMR